MEKKFNEWLRQHNRQMDGSAPEPLLGVLTQILDLIDDGVLIHDQDRRVYLFNRSAEQILGVGRAAILGQDCREIFKPDGICGSNCQFCQTDPTASVHACSYELDYDRQGDTRRLKVTVEHLLAGPVGQPAVVAVLRDITEVSQLRRRFKEKYSFRGMVGRSEAMQEVFDTIRQVTVSDYPVLITGASGTGKELVAQAIHNESRRSSGPFVPINCGALPVNILESELFGHVRGAFTGAIRDKKGRFELADGGTLFLDEVGELDPSFQVKLLRVLQEKKFEMVGGEKEISVDVRIISATNRDLGQMVAQGQFRQDLFYRLAVVPIALPPLKDRGPDIPLLIERILADVQQELDRHIEGLSDAAMDLLMTHDWPGNVRELINALQFAAVRCPGALIEPTHLPPSIRRTSDQPRSDTARRTTPRGRQKLSPERVEQALAETGGNKVQAARALGVGRATLYRYLRMMDQD